MNEDKNIYSESSYFSSYSNFDIHRTMIDDYVRTGAYHRAITTNRHLFRDKIVLDIGSGTGILSLFAATAGAAKVYAFENSNIVKTAKQLAETNKVRNIVFVDATVENFLMVYLFYLMPGAQEVIVPDFEQMKKEFRSNFLAVFDTSLELLLLQKKFSEEMTKISLAKKSSVSSLDQIKNHVETVLRQSEFFRDSAAALAAADLFINKASVLVSEWMGYGLLAERMLPCVLLARDFLLKPVLSDTNKFTEGAEVGGTMFPSRANLFCAGLENFAIFADARYWGENAWGFDFSLLSRYQSGSYPLTDLVSPKSLNSAVSLVRSFDLKRVKIEELEFEARYELDFYFEQTSRSNQRIPTKKNKVLHGLVFWFDVEFADCHKSVWLDTSPFARQTHWVQTVYLLDEEMRIYKNTKKGLVVFRNSFTKDNERSLDQSFSISIGGNTNSVFYVL